MKANWEQLRSKNSTDSFAANAVGNFFPLMCCDKHKKHDKRDPDLLKGDFSCSEMLCFCGKTYCCYDKTSSELKISSKGLMKRKLEQSGDGPLGRYLKVLDESVNITSTNKCFRTKKNTVATYEQTERGLSLFYPKRIVEDDGINTHPVNL